VYGVIGCCFFIFVLTFFHSYFLYKAKAVLLGMMFFGMGIILHFFNTFQPEAFTFPPREKIVFKISKKLNSSEKNKKYEAEVQTGKHRFDAIIYLPKQSKELDFEHYYRAEAYITQPKAPQYDFQFNYARYLNRKGIGYQCYISGEITSAARNDLSNEEKVRQNRLNVLQKIDHTVMDGKTREFLKGIILADRTETDSGTVQDFNRSGLVHLLAISGTHVVVIFGLFYFVLARFSPLRFRKYAVILSVTCIWIFAAFIGFGNSVVRSCIMLSVYFVYVLLQRKPDLLHSLSLSALIILCMDTQQLFDVGFQLSFLAVLGIFWFNQPLLKYFPRQDHYLKKLLFNTITISLSAQWATLPLVLYYFHQFSFISIVANIVIVPFSELIIVFSFLMTVLIALNADFILVNMIYDFGIHVLLKLIHWFAEIDALYYVDIPMTLTEMFLLLGAAYGLGILIRKCSLENVVRLMAAVVVFFIFRVTLNTYEGQKDEILLYEGNKSKIFSVKNGSRVVFWTAETAEKDKIIRFIVSPYCSSRRVDSYQLKTFPMTVNRVEYKGKIYDLK
jgi:competence protein ComEC